MKTLIALTLVLAASPLALAQKRDLPPYPQHVLMWKKEEPFADDFIVDGATVRVIKNGDLTVAMFSFLDDGYEVAEVIVANGTDHRVTVKPEDFFLTYQDGPKKMGYEFSLPPSKVAGKIRGRVRWANFFRAFAAGMSQTTT